MKALAGCPRCPCRPKMGSVMSECRRCSGSLKCFERITDHNQKSHSQKRTLNARRSGQTSLAFAEALILQTSLALLMRTMEIKNLVTCWSHVGSLTASVELMMASRRLKMSRELGEKNFVRFRKWSRNRWKQSNAIVMPIKGGKLHEKLHEKHLMKCGWGRTKKIEFTDDEVMVERMLKRMEQAHILQVCCSVVIV